MDEYARAGSQRWLQIAVNRRPELLLNSLRRCGAVGKRAAVEWKSPLASDGFREYRDDVALRKAGVGGLNTPLRRFWPPRGPVWDAIGATSDGTPLFVEAKAHIAEAASPGTKASPASKTLILSSLAAARRYYAPRAKAEWSGIFYQYANRLAHHYFLRSVNGAPSALVFLYFINADDMGGPATEAEWHGATRLIHAALGLPANLEGHGIHHAYLDVRHLHDAGMDGTARDRSVRSSGHDLSACKN